MFVIKLILSFDQFQYYLNFHQKPIFAKILNYKKIRFQKNISILLFQNHLTDVQQIVAMFFELFQRVKISF